jgi:hypothetical protein
MKPVTRGEVLGIAEYEMVREPFRRRVLEEKKRRRIALGDHASLLFETHDSVLLQVQEMLRTERITREAAVVHEIETYNDLVPRDGELSCTLFVEVDDPDARAALLERLAGLERSVRFEVGAERAGATFDAARVYPDRASAVNYFKFALTRAARDGVLSAARGEALAPEVAFVVDHAAYPVRALLSRATLAALAEDLES